MPVAGNKIHALRKQLRLTREQLADRIKIPGRSTEFSARHLFNIETGRTPTVHLATFHALLKALERVEVEDISPDKTTTSQRSSDQSEVARGFSGVLRSEVVRRRITRRSERVRKKLYDAFISSPVKWGPSLFSTDRRVANVCEILLSFDEKTLAGRWRKLVDPLNWLLSQQRHGAFPSLSRDVLTTHCTALGSLACARVSGWNQLPSDLRQRASKAAVLAAEACLNMAGERGWGTWGKGSVRIQPTIWALRALARYPRLFRRALFDRFEQLRAMHSVGSPGCFGFRPGTERRVSPSASFLLLCAELETIGYKPPSIGRYFLEQHNAAQFVASERPSDGCWKSEAELYYVDPE